MKSKWETISHWMLFTILILVLSGVPPAGQASRTPAAVFVENFSNYNRLDTLNGTNWDIWGHQLALAHVNNALVLSPIPLLLTTGMGYVAWLDTRNSRSDGDDIYLQKVDARGNRLWQHDLRITSDDSYGYRFVYDLAPAPEGGVFVVYTDEPFNVDGIYAQRISSSGALIWRVRVNQAPLGNMNSNVDVTAEITPQGDIAVAWTYSSQLWLQRIQPDGKSSWSSDVIVNSLNPIPDSVRCFALGADTSGNIMAAWYSDNDLDIQAQGIGPTGTRTWPQPLVVASAPNEGSYHGLKVVAGPDSSTFFFWGGSSSGSDFAIYGQRLSAVGKRMWPERHQVSAESDYSMHYQIDALIDKDSKLRVWWPGVHDDVFNIYWQKVEQDGALIYEHDKPLINTPPDGYEIYLNNASLNRNGAALLAYTFNDGNRNDSYSITVKQVSSDGKVITPYARTINELNGRNYLIDGFAQSNRINAGSTPVLRARLDADYAINGGAVRFYLSNNGGHSWELVTPGVSHTFTHSGSDLRWRVGLKPSTDLLHSPVIRSIHVTEGPEEVILGKNHYLPMIIR